MSDAREEAVRTAEAAGFNRRADCRYGEMLYHPNDSPIGRSLERYGEWAQDEMELLWLFVRAGNLVVDAGANIGTHTLFFSERVGSAGQVVSFEPQRAVFEALRANVAINGLANVLTVHAALGSRSGSAIVPATDYEREGNFGGVRLTADGEGSEVEVLALDNLDLSGCALIKIDVEGMELDVIDGARNLIRTSKPAIYLEANRDGLSEVFQRLLSNDYRLYWHFSQFFNRQNYRRNKDNCFGPMFDANVLATRSAVDFLLPVDGIEDSPNEALNRKQAR